MFGSACSNEMDLVVRLACSCHGDNKSGTTAPPGPRAQAPILGKYNTQDYPIVQHKHQRKNAQRAYYTLQGRISSSTASACSLIHDLNDRLECDLGLEENHCLPLFLPGHSHPRLLPQTQVCRTQYLGHVVPSCLCRPPIVV